jgi:hypothetical protein
MEKRWLARRHQEVASQLMGEEQRSALKQWADRRARVEEEIAHNIEASRCQATLEQRGFELQLPPDAEEDIEPSVQGIRHEPRLAYTRSPSDGKRQRRPHSAASAGSRASGSVGSWGKAAAKAETATEVRFREPWEGKPRPLSARVGRLRQLHAKFLQSAPDPELEAALAAGDETISAEPFFETHEGAGHMTLSAYTRGGENQPAAVKLDDDVDVLAASCDLWQSKNGEVRARRVNGGDTSSSLHEMRLQQLAEVDDVVRAFARKNCPLDEATVSRITDALVMADHKIRTCPGGKLFNDIPNGLPINPYSVPDKPAKPKKRRAPKRRPASAIGSRRPY